MPDVAIQVNYLRIGGIVFLMGFDDTGFFKRQQVFVAHFIDVGNNAGNEPITYVEAPLD